MNNEYNNLNENQEAPQIIGFDQLTGQPIFNNGLGVREEKKESKQVEKKVMSKGKFIFHIFLSLVLWNFITNVIYRFLTYGIYQLLENNVFICFLIINVLTIGSSALQIFLTYWFNKFNTPQEYQLRSAKNINLIMFLIGLIFINMENIEKIFNGNLIVSIVMGVFLVIHMITIWFVNEKIFDKYWGVDHF